MYLRYREPYWGYRKGCLRVLWIRSKRDGKTEKSTHGSRVQHQRSHNARVNGWEHDRSARSARPKSCFRSARTRSLARALIQHAMATANANVSAKAKGKQKQIFTPSANWLALQKASTPFLHSLYAANCCTNIESEQVEESGQVDGQEE